MDKTIVKKLSIPIYGCEVHFIIAPDIKKELNRIAKKYKDEDPFVDDYEGMSLCYGMQVYYLVVDEKHLSYNTLIHEIFHTVCRIAGHREIKEEESCCWIAGHIAAGIFKFLDTKKITIKHGN